jgi:hypothetical protein
MEAAISCKIEVLEKNIVHHQDIAHKTASVTHIGYYTVVYIIRSWPGQVRVDV